MRLRQALAALFAGLTCLPRAAWAQAWDAHPTVNLIAGYSITRVYGLYPTDDANLLSGPQLTPSFSLLTTYDTPLTKSRMNTLLSGVVPFDNSLHFVAKRFNYHVQLNLTTTADLDPRTDLKSVVNAGVTPTNVLAGVVVDAAQAPLDAAPQGVTYLVNTSLEETVKHQLSKLSSVSVAALLRYNMPYNPQKAPPSTLTFKPTLTGSRVVDDNTFSLSPGTQIIRFGAGQVNLAVVDTHYQYVNTLKGTWARPILRSLKGTLNVGVNQTFTVGTINSTNWSGLGGLNLTFDAGIGKVTLNYNHDVTVNGLTGQLNVSDLATLNFTTPIGATARLATFNVAYNHTEPIAGDGTLTGNVTDHFTMRTTFPIGATGLAPAVSAAYLDVRPAGQNGVFGAGFRSWTGDATAAYSHDRLKQLSFNLRAQLIWKQPYDNPVNESLRYTITAGVGFAWPGQGEHAAAFQVRVAPAYTPTPVLSSEANSAAGEDPAEFTNPRELTRPGAVDVVPEAAPPPPPAPE